MSGGGKRLDLTGIYPPIATPFNQDESIAWDKLTLNMNKWTQEPIRGFLVQVTSFSSQAGRFQFIEGQLYVSVFTLCSCIYCRRDMPAG
jgi:hypothetical protein